MRWIAAWLLAPLALAAQTRADDLCPVSGQVTNAVTGEPIARSIVSLRRVDASPGVNNVQTAGTVSTDSTGLFVFPGVAPGKYSLTAERNGFVTAQYGARGPGRAGTLLTLDAGRKSSGLAIRLTPHGVITGRVLDEDGDPVSGVDVQSLRLQYAEGGKQMARVNGATTNDLGEYRVFGLAPGRYYVSAALRSNSPPPQTDDQYVTTYFPRATDAAAATPIDVAAGAQMRNIDIVLARMRTVAIRGRAVNEVRSPPGENGQAAHFIVLLSPRNAAGVSTGLTRSTPVSPQGTFEFRNVTPGSYFLSGWTNTQGKILTARAALEVASSNIEGFVLTIHRGVQVSGKVRMEGNSAASIAQARVKLLPAEPGGLNTKQSSEHQVKADGSFQLDEVAADRYKVVVDGLPEGCYVKTVRSGAVDVMANGLEIGGASPAPLDVVLSPNAGQVTGTVHDPKEQKAAAAMTVVLVPQEKERRDRGEFYRVATSGPAGQFTFKNVTPGEYRVFAWEDVEPNAWMDAEFLKPLESQSQAVGIREGGRETVQVNLIPADLQ